MMDYWGAFARNGAPAAPDAPAWQAYSEQQAYMRFAKSATPARNLLPGMFEMQEEVVRRRRAANRQWFVNVGIAAPVVTDARSRLAEPRGRFPRSPPRAGNQAVAASSEERSVGKERGSTCRSRWSPER